LSTIQQCYDAGVTDEFLDPIRSGNDNDAMQSDDTVLFFNFRSDRARQITSKLMETMQVVSMTQYDEQYA